MEYKKIFNQLLLKNQVVIYMQDFITLDLIKVIFQLENGGILSK